MLENKTGIHVLVSVKKAPPTSTIFTLCKWDPKPRCTVHVHCISMDSLWITQEKMAAQIETECSTVKIN